MKIGKAAPSLASTKCFISGATPGMRYRYVMTRRFSWAARSSCGLTRLPREAVSVHRPYVAVELEGSREPEPSVDEEEEDDGGVARDLKLERVGRLDGHQPLHARPPGGLAGLPSSEPVDLDAHGPQSEGERGVDHQASVSAAQVEQHVAFVGVHERQRAAEDAQRRRVQRLAGRQHGVRAAVKVSEWGRLMQID